MDVILVKILAAFLALSQVATTPQAIKTEFVETRDQAEVVGLLRGGCAHMRKAFDIELIDLDGLIATALDDPQALTAEIKAFRGLNFGSLHLVYRQFCKNETVEPAPVDIGQVIAYYNKATADLPDHARLKGLKLSGTSTVLDATGGRFAEVFEAENRRVWIPLKDIPQHVQNAFVAAEDKRFHQHKGIDERGLIRAMVANLARPGRPQGGSTITQQVVKNFLVGDDLTYERKIREMILASRVEQTLSKNEILELYLNSIYLGRNSWGIELAARSYYGKPASELTLAEGATLAGLTKGPNYYSPDRHPERAQERLAYVLSRMQEDGAITQDAADQARRAALRLVAYDRVAAQFRLLFPRPHQSRGEIAAGRGCAHGKLGHRSLDHSPAIAAGGGDRAAGGPRPLRAFHRARSIPRRGGQSRRRDPTHPGRPECAEGASGLATGAAGRAAPALRCALAKRRGGAEGRRRCDQDRARGRARAAAQRRERGRAPRPQASRRRPGPRDRRQGSARRAEGPARRCRARFSCWRTRTGASSRWRAASPIR